MSLLEVPSLDTVLETTPESIKRAAGKEAAARRDAERRAHRRVKGSELRWLRKARLKNGPEVSLLDLSSGGALIETRVQMRPGSAITLEVAGGGSVVEISSEVVRCGIASLQSGAPIYRGACLFENPLSLEEIGRAPVVAAVEAVAGSVVAWQKIVVRYRDGGTLKGYTLDFHPSRAHLSLWPSVRAQASERVIVPLTRLKALYFVKEFAGNSTHVGSESFQNAGSGRKIEVTFFDKEVVRGTTLNYRPDGMGFFLTPADTGGNNQRLFVINGAIRQVRFP
jgi:hypothetical protein